MSSPVPVLFTIPNVTTAGSGRALFEVARRLPPHGFQPSLLVARDGGPLLTAFREAGIDVHTAPFTVPGRPYRTLRSRVARAARAVPRGHALWHSYHYLDDYTEPMIARAAGIRRWVYTKKNMNWGRRSWWVRSTLASAICAQNRDMIRSFFRGPLAARAHWVPRGVDVRRFHPAADPPVPSDVLRVGCVAHLVPVKGHPTLLDAVARVPEVHLTLAGRADDAAYAEGLHEQVRRLGLDGRVTFAGGLEDVPAFLRGLDAFVLPTWARWRMEGCPVALLEAMATALPVIATDVPGSRDLVRDGDTGWLVPPEDADALADALTAIAADPEAAAERGRRARAAVESEHTIDQEVERHAAAYRAALGGRVR